jgi:hypothetical protein
MKLCLKIYFYEKKFKLKQEAKVQYDCTFACCFRPEEFTLEFI